MQDQFNNEDDLWQYVEDKKRRPVLPETRHFFEERQLISEILDGDEELRVDSLHQLLDELNGFFRALDESGHGPTPVTRREQLRGDEQKTEQEDVSEERMLLSALAGAAASKLKWVQLFRKSFLPEGLLKLQDIEGWIQMHVLGEGPIAELLTIALPASHQIIVDPQNGYVVDPPLEMRKIGNIERERQWLELTWSIPLSGGDVSLCIKRIPLGGVLEQLYNLSRDLAAELQWRDEDATTFVLTGLLPLLPRIRVKRIRSSLREVPTYITILVDPDTSPQDLSEFYQGWRNRLGYTRSRRPLGARNRALVWFVLLHPDMSWDDRAALWRKSEDTKNYAAFYDGDTMRKAFHKAQKSILPKTPDDGTVWPG